MNALAKATRVRVVTNPYDLSPKDLGYAENVEERIVKTDNWVFVEKYKNPQAVSILTRGGSERVVNEAERSMHDALMVVKYVVQKPAIVAGGGSPEAYVSGKLDLGSRSPWKRASSNSGICGCYSVDSNYACREWRCGCN